MKIHQFYSGVLLIIVFVQFFLIVNSEAQTFEFESTILGESTFSIKGESNVTSIYCSYITPFPAITMRHTSVLDIYVFEVQGDSLFLDIDGFDCGKRAINRDMRNTLNQEKYPQIIAWIDYIFIGEFEDALASVSVSISGVVNQYEIRLESLEDDEIMRITGEHEIKLSDYNLKPPQALFGLVKVSDVFTVAFDLFIGKKKGS